MAGDTKAFTIPAGGTYPINGNGETYIFCQFADRPINVKIAGKTVTMRAGGYQEFEPLGGPNARVEFENTDPDNPAAVIFILGTGTYDEKIVRGEISIEPILRNADGTTKTDTRYDLQMSLNPLSVAVRSLQAGDTVEVGNSGELGSSPQESFIAFGPGRTIYNFSTANNTNYLGHVYSRDTLDYIGVASGLRLGLSAPNGISCVAYQPGRGWVVGRNTGTLYLMEPDPSTTGDAVFSSLKNILESDMEALISLQYDEEAGNLISYQRNGTTSKIRVTRFDLDLNEVSRFEISSSFQTATYDSFNGWHTLYRKLGGNTDAYVYDETGELVKTVEMTGKSLVTIDDLTQTVIHYRDYVYVTTGGNPSSIQKWAFDDFTTKPEFFAVRPGCEYQGVLRNFRSANISADINVSETLEGVLFSGQVIKAAIEYYFKRRAPDNYLDHVYGFDSSTVGFKPVNSGNRTFAAANIEDDFEITAPGELVLKIDNELKLGALL